MSLDSEFLDLFTKPSLIFFVNGKKVIELNSIVNNITDELHFGQRSCEFLIISTHFVTINGQNVIIS